MKLANYKLICSNSSAFTSVSVSHLLHSRLLDKAMLRSCQLLLIWSIPNAVLNRMASDRKLFAVARKVLLFI